MSTPDHFSSQAGFYREFRPTYPAALFDWLARSAPGRTLAWDCGCGSGQATLDLARRFVHVHATDLSQKQLDQAESRPNIQYVCAPAEQSGLADATADLVLVAQALHWFDFDAFFAEVRRVARPGGLFAAITYNLLSISPAVDAIIGELYWHTLDGCWPPERKHVEEGYRNIPMPLAPIQAPAFDLQAEWTLPQLLGYLRSWSATAAFLKQHGQDPVAGCEAALAAAWGDPAAALSVRFPLTVLAGRA